MFTVQLPQIVPPQVCLKCEVCCRYLSPATIYVPYFFPEEIKNIHPEEGDFTAAGSALDFKPLPVTHKDCYICRFFVPQENKCRIYSHRPYDCRLYPFMITYAQDYQSIVLVLDTKCPYCQDKFNTQEFKSYGESLLKALDSPLMAGRVKENRNFISDFQEDTIVIGKLENLSRQLCFPALGLRKLSLQDKGWFDEYFLSRAVFLSAFAFTSIYIWQPLLNILWKRIGGELCVFAGNEEDYFIFLPPKGQEAIEESLRILDGLNGQGNPASRIENVPAGLAGELAQLGFDVKAGAPEYIYSREKLAGLKGNEFKSKRALVNNFLKNYPVKTRTLQEEDIRGCLKLYRQWARQKLSGKDDDYFRALIEDSYFAQKIALSNVHSLGIEGLVIEIDGAIQGYTLGFSLDTRVFVNLFETADLTRKGLPQFLFRELARGLTQTEYINALSDSGLSGETGPGNLRRVKESYHPWQKLEVWTASTA
ncbi:MAG: phosphatidylglycerol lysyltransferase domain-containing protein [Candidatus Omnitrophota bacterium]